MSEWQPIETAKHYGHPKILVWDGDQMHVARYDFSRERSGSNEWVELSGWHSGGEYLDPQPTHWMPLPEPPK